MLATWSERGDQRLTERLDCDADQAMPACWEGITHPPLLKRYGV